MTEALSPREIIEQLDVNEIDRSIEELTEEINALRALRRVAAAKNGKAPSTGGRGNGRADNPPRSNSRPNAVTMERVESAYRALQAEGGTMHYTKLAEKVGYQPNSAFWVLRNCEKDSRFSVEGEIISLASMD